MSQAFDIIFAGGKFLMSIDGCKSFAHPTTGGTTACVVAGRLAAVDPSLKILVIESGQHSRDVPRHVQPCRSVEHLTPDSTTLLHHIAKPSAHLNGRAAIVSCARSVGGGSAINCESKAADCPLCSAIRYAA